MKKKLLLDECVPIKLAKHFLNDFEVSTVHEMNWDGEKDGPLIQFAGKHGFAAMISADKQLQNQQDTKHLPIMILVFQTAKCIHYDQLLPFLPEMITCLKFQSEPGIYTF